MRIELPLRVTKCKHIIRMSNWHTSVITGFFSCFIRSGKSKSVLNSRRLRKKQPMCFVQNIIYNNEFSDLLPF